MNRFYVCAIPLCCALLIAPRDSAGAQDMAMASRTLLVAKLEGAQTVPASSSRASGTGAFLLDPTHLAIAYALTYQGLEFGRAVSIVLRNFGRGANGETVSVLCGEEVRPCPPGTGATISGSIDRTESRPFDNKLVGEFDSERIYVEIAGTGGKREIRGQLSPNDAMVPVSNYVAHLAPAEGANSKGSGTAVLSEVYLPGGKVSVFYDATVAGTSGAPVGAALIGVPARPVPKSRAFALDAALPALQLRIARGRATGGSLGGIYEVNRNAPRALFAARILSAGNKEAGIVVTTSRFPDGELYGAFEPVR